MSADGERPWPKWSADVVPTYPISEETLREVMEREKTRPHPAPCGTEGNPHLLAPQHYPDGPCIKCGWIDPESDWLADQ